MALDLSKFSDEDLAALNANDLSKVSDAGLTMINQQSEAKPKNPAAPAKPKRMERSAELMKPGAVTGDIEKRIEAFNTPRTPTGFNANKIMGSGLEGTVIGTGLALGAAPFTGGASLALVPEFAAGGAVSSVLGTLADQMGLSNRVKLLAEITGGGLGKPIVNITSRILSKGTQAAASLLESGDMPAAFKALKGIAGETPEEAAKRAALEQQKQFGKPVKDYSAIQGGTNTAFQEKTQTQLRDQISKTLNIPVEQGQKASAAVRETMYNDVGNIASTGAPEIQFSKSDAFKKLEKDLETKLATKEITKEDFKYLMQTLKTDVNKNPEVRAQFGKTVDRVIREFSGQDVRKPLNKNITEGIRESVRNAFGEWTESAGLGKVEKAYRDAYRAEKVAEAKDMIPNVISSFTGKTEEAKAIVKQLGDGLNDAKPIFKQAIKEHLASIPAKDVPAEFKRLGSLLENVGALTPYEVNAIGEKAAMVGKVSGGGSVESAADRFKRVIIRSLGGATAGEAGSDIFK